MRLARSIFRLVSIAGWMIKGTLLLIALTALFLWPRGYWQKDRLVNQRRIESREAAALEWRWMASERGWIWASIYRHVWVGRDAAERLRQDYQSLAFTPGWSKGSQPADDDVLRYRQRDGGSGPIRWRSQTAGGPNPIDQSGEIRISNWLVALLCGAWPITGLALSTRRRIRRRRTAREGHCRVCGYDLRASPDRCPECGTSPKVDP